MRCIVMVKATRDSEAGVMPSEQLLTEMGKYNDQLVKAGVMLAGEGLHPSSKGARVRFSGSKRTVIDGPFTETKELVAGFWIWQVRSMAEAIEWLKRCPNPHNEECEVEIRPVFSPEDFGEALTPELKEQEDRQRADIEKQKQAGPSGTPGKSASSSSKSIFVNLPIRDLKRSVEFFTKLGYTFNPQFTDENATCMIVSENIYVMLLVEKFFKTFTPKPIADARSSTQSIVAVSEDSREAVVRVVKSALGAGAKRNKEPQDHGFMYLESFEDLDGHIWEHFWMDPAHIKR